MVLHVPKSKQYLLIGKEGAAIRALERDFECRVDVPTAEDQARTVIVRGSVANVLAAHRRMQQLTGMRLGETPLSIAHLTIPHGAHGALIGRQGAKLRELEERFNCDIAIPKRESNCDEVVAEGLVPDLQALREELSLMLQQQVLMQVSTPTEEVESSDLMDELKCDPATILRRPLVDLTAVFDEVICFGPSLQSDDVSAFGIDRFFDVLRSAKVSLDISVFTLSDTRIANIVVCLQLFSTFLSSFFLNIMLFVSGGRIQ
jgi:ribosomal protein S3